MVETWVEFSDSEKPWKRFDEKERWLIIEEEGLTMPSRDEDEG